MAQANASIAAPVPPVAGPTPTTSTPDLPKNNRGGARNNLSFVVKKNRACLDANIKSFVKNFKCGCKRECGNKVMQQVNAQETITKLRDLRFRGALLHQKREKSRHNRSNVRHEIGRSYPGVYLNFLKKTRGLQGEFFSPGVRLFFLEAVCLQQVVPIPGLISG